MVQRLSVLGEEILEIKQEVLESTRHSAILQKALNAMVSDMFKQKIFNVDIHHALMNQDMTKDEFYLQLLETSGMKKSNEELEEEFKAIGNQLIDNPVIQKGIVVTINPVIEKDRVEVQISFEADEEFTQDYFGVESPDLTKKLLERGGFIERFVVLRFNKIIKDYLKTKEGYSETEDEIEVDYGFLRGTTSYFDEVKGIYAVDYVISILIEEVEDRFESVKESVENEMKQAIDYFSNRIAE